MDPTPLVRLVDVHKSFSQGDGVPSLSILRGVTLQVNPGQRLAIMGPSGSGKSTVLNLLGGLDRPTRGEIWVGRENIATLNDNALALVRNRVIGFVFQSHHLLPHCTVWENVLVPSLAEHSVAGSAVQERAHQLLKRVGLSDRINHRPGQLSGGERQRVAVVRSLINHPQIVLADEPTGALDRTSASEISSLLVELNREEKVALIVVTHAPDLARAMGEVYELQDGFLRRSGEKNS